MLIAVPLAELCEILPVPDAQVARHGLPIERGMSLRDWFASQALVGLLAAPVVPDEPRAVLAYRYADAMLEARKEPT